MYHDWTLNDDFESPWKKLELIRLSEFHSDPEILFRACAPESILKGLNLQLSETIRVWYTFKSRLLADSNMVEMHRLDSLWFNQNICLKTKKWFYYPTWYEKGIKTVQDLIYNGTRFKEFFELILEFDIPIGDKRKYFFITKAIPMYRLWSNDNRDPYEFLKEKLLVTKNLSKFSYSIFKDFAMPQKKFGKWNENFNVEKDSAEWSLIHKANFKCTIETQLQSFYFKSFHRAIATNDFFIQD